MLGIAGGGGGLTSGIWMEQMFAPPAEVSHASPDQEVARFGFGKTQEKPPRGSEPADGFHPNPTIVSWEGLGMEPSNAPLSSSLDLWSYFFWGGGVFHEFGVTNRRREQEFHSDRMHLRPLSQCGVLHGGGVWG